MKKILFLLILVLPLLGVSPLTATKMCAQHSLVVTIDSSNYVGGCDDSTGFLVTVKNTGSIPMTGITIKIFFSSGVYWTSTDGPIVDSTITLLWIGYDSISAGATDTFSYYVRGSCVLLNQGNYHDYVTVSYDSLLTHHSYSFYHDYQVESPHLVFNNDSSINLSVATYMGETFTKKLFLKNDGDAPLVNGQVVFKDAHGIAVTINSIQIIANSTVLTTTTYTNTASAIIPFLNHGDSLLIVENVTVVGCLDSGAGNSFDTIRWGCLSSLCDTIPVTAIVYRSQLQPLSFFTVLNDLKDSACEGSWKHWQIAICDTSLVPCQHFSFLFSRHGLQYSLIDADSIVITRNHSSIHFDSLHLSTLDPLEHFYTNTCYSAVGNNPLDYIQYYYDTLKQGDTIFIDFDTYKCCGNDTNNLHFNGPAPEYTFNDWYIKLHWNDECGSPDSSLDFISPHDAQGYIQLVQEFQPQVTDMNGSHIQWANADSASFFITNTGFTNLLPDSFYRYFNRGYLMVKIKTDLGLRYKGTVYFSNYNNTETWYPYRVDSTIGDTVLIDTLYEGYQDSITAYFRFDTLANFDSLYYFLIRSQINFQLYSYCNAAAPKSRYYVETMWRNDTTCADCLIPLNRQGSQIQVHCPGCQISGDVATYYRLTRISRGERDDNNDGIMDTLAPATDALINHSRGIVGDTLVGTLIANIVDGIEVDSIHGATLAFVEDTLFPLNYCYLYTTLDHSNHFRIYDVMVTITDSTHTAIFSQDNLNAIVEHNYNLYGNRYLYDLSLGTLQSHGLDTGYRYHIGDIFTVVTKYRIDLNTVNTQLLPDIININNTIYLTGIADDLSYDPVINYPTAGDINATFGRDSLKPKDLFWCEAYAGLFYQYPVNIVNQSAFYNAVKTNDYCSKYAVCEAKSYIGGSEAGFAFPFEYRQPPVLDTIRFILPQGYSLTGATSVLRYPFWMQPYWYNAYYEQDNVPYNGDTVNSFGDSVYLYVVPPLYSYLTSLPVETTYFTDSVPIADEIFDYKLYVYITPTCGMTAQNTYIIDSSDFNYHNRQPQMVFSDTIYHFLGTDSIIRVGYDAYAWYNQVLTLAHPVADFVITSNTQTVSQQEVCWDFFVENNSLDDEPIDNLWAYLYSPSGRITLDYAYLMPGNILLTVTSDSIIQLNSQILPDSIAYFEICCHYSCDTANAQDSMVLYYGWNCFGYPTTIRDPNLCNKDTAVFHMIQAGAELAWKILGPDTVTNCDTLHYEIIITASQLGSVYDLTAIVNLPYYLAYLPGSGILEYPTDTFTSTVGPTINGDSLYWYLDSTSSLLHTVGIGDGDSLVLYFDLLASCGFSGDSLIMTATITGITFCGDTLKIHPWFQNLVVTNCSVCCHLINTYGITNVSCNGWDDGEIIAYVSDGTGPYTYVWSPTGGTTATASNLTAGTYTLIVTDSSGCSKTDTIVVTQPEILTDSIVYQTNVSCFGDSSGKVTVTGVGGTIAYSYEWNTIPTQTGATAVNLSAGTYTVTVTDANGCTTTSSVTITQPELLIASIASQTNVLCFGDSTGTATATASGGTPGYSYEWNTIPSQTDITAINLSTGIYTVTVTDTLGCTATASVTITQPDSVLKATIPFALVTNENCFGDSTGSAAVIATGGTRGYSYSWSTTPVQTTITATGLTAGNYTVTVTDTNGCTATAITTIHQPLLLKVICPPGMQVMDSCFGLHDGRAVAIASGGTPLYSYLWSNGDTTSVINGLAAGIYTITVTDSHGCTAVTTVTITQPDLLVATIIDSVNILCNGGNTGSATVSVTGGTIPYLYLWNTIPSQTTPTAINLSAGTYTVTVTDLHGCTATASVTITQPSAISITTTFSSPSCYDTTDISIIAHTSGGTPFSSYPYYYYSWNTIPVQSTDTAVGLGTGTYIVSVKDSNGCIWRDTVSIFPFIVNSITATGVSCIPNANDGTATISVFGGASPYTYLWSNGQTNMTADSLSVGTYYVTVTDSNSCTLVDSINITAAATCCYSQNYTHVIVHDTTFTGSYTYPSGSFIAVTGNILVSGTGTTLNFTGCDVQLAPDVMIEVSNCSTLIIDSSHLHAACDTMWHEILVNRCSKVIITRNSLIEDADTAVHSIIGGLYFIDHSGFNKNYIGIYLDGSILPENHSTVQTTNFYCKDVYPSGTDSACLLTPHLHDLSNTGIKIVNFVDYPTSSYAPLAIGGMGVGNNFEYMDYGIFGNNSTNTDIENNNFKFIFRDGIRVDNTGFTDIEYYNTFELCQWGVHTTNYVNTTVKLNEFTNCVRGVETYKDQGSTLNVEISANTLSINNTYEVDSFLSVVPDIEIYCHLDDGATHNIWGNSISNSYDDNQIFGILCEQTSITTAAPYFIFQNSIDNCTFGIYGVDLVYPQVYSHDSSVYYTAGITVQSQADYDYTSGIILLNCAYPSVYDNDIVGHSGDENNSDVNNGIRVDMSYTPKVFCNEVGNVSKGVWFGGFNPGPFLAGNTFDSCYDQLFLNYDDLGLGYQGIGGQDNLNNWTINFVNSNTNAYFSNGLGYTYFYASCSCAPDAPLVNVFNIAPCSYIDTTTTSYSGCPDVPTAEGAAGRYSLEKRIAGDSITWGSDSSSLKWLAKEYLYKRFAEDSTLVTQDTVLQHAKDSLSGTTIATIKTVSDTLSLADTLVGTDSLSNIQDSVLKQQALASATATNNSINPNIIIEQNYKTVNDIYLNTVAVGIDTFTNGQYSQLVSVASQCPYTGGGAVYTARVLLHIVERTMYFDDVCNTNNNARLMGKDKSTKSNIFGKLYPNPNNGTMQYDYDLPKGSTGQLIISDVMGQNLFSYILIEGKNSLKIQINDLAEGVYLYKVNVDGKIIKKDKLVILK